MTDTQPMDDYDSPWKEALEAYFTECLTFFFPEVAADIDWTMEYHFLDKELQQVTPDAATGRRTVDKLVEVWCKSGKSRWVLVHLEVQSQHDPDFAERMYMYNYRLFDHYHEQVASFAILGDESPTWRPTRYGYQLWECEVSLKFPVVKLWDYREQLDELKRHANPFAVVVLAHLYTQKTRGQPKERYTLKWQLTRMLYERGYTKRDIQLLFRFIDWVMRLPPVLKERFRTQLIAYEEEQKMTYVTETIQLSKEDGIQQGLQHSTLEVLTLRFSDPHPAIVERIHAIDDTALLKTLHRQAVLAESLEKFRQFMDETLAQTAQPEDPSAA
jgi:hypothetical protein